MELHLIITVAQACSSPLLAIDNKQSVNTHVERTVQNSAEIYIYINIPIRGIIHLAIIITITITC